MAVTLGVLLPTWKSQVETTPVGTRWRELLARAAEAADAGARVICVPDHLDYPEGSVNLECWTVLAAVAVAVPGVALLPLVLSVPLRAPGLVAAMTLTLDEIAPGRLRLGLGAGVDAREHLDAGVAFGTPGDRVSLVETVAATVRAHCAANGSEVALVIAGGGARMLDVAARHGDEWNCGMRFADRRVDRLAALDQACVKTGRTVRRSAFVSVLGGEPPDGDAARRYNLHLALRGTSTERLVEEIAEVAAEGFDAVYVGARTSLAWDATLGALQSFGGACV